MESKQAELLIEGGELDGRCDSYPSTHGSFAGLGSKGRYTPGLAVELAKVAAGVTPLDDRVVFVGPEKKWLVSLMF